VVEALVIRATVLAAGIGTQLMRAVENWASAKGATLSTVDSYVLSPASIALLRAGDGLFAKEGHVPKEAPWHLRLWLSHPGLWTQPVLTHRYEGSPIW